MNVAVIHPGTQHSWQTATAIHRLGRLQWFATSILYRPDRFPYWLERIAPGRLGERLHYEFSRFDHPPLADANVISLGGLEWAERIARRAGLQALAGWLDARGNAHFARCLASLIASPMPFALWSYDGVARMVFEQGKRQGRSCILDRTTPDMRAFAPILAGLHDDFDEWFAPGPPAITPGIIATDDAEYALADRIVVGSEYAASTIREHAASEVGPKVRVLPYCYDEALFGHLPPPRPVAPHQPVRFLFSGRIWPAKGAHHVLEAIRRLSAAQAELTLVGSMNLDPQMFARYADRVRHIPQVPRSAMPGLMCDHHVLLFPSYFEGGGITMLEGQAAGMALIQTPNADHVATEATGIMLDAPDTDQLHAAMVALCEDRQRLDSMRAAAQVAAQARSFTVYTAGIAKLLADAAL